MIFFILVGGAPGTIWDHIKPKNGRKKGAKNSQNRVCFFVHGGDEIPTLY